MTYLELIQLTDRGTESDGFRHDQMAGVRYIRLCVGH